MDVILISGIFLTFFIVVLLLTKKQKALTDKILAAWIAVIGIHLLGFYYNQMGYWEKYPHLIGVTAPVPLIHGPMLYLYCLYSLRNERRIRPVDYLHFAPVVLAYLYMIRFFLYTAEEKLMVDRGEVQSYAVFANLLLVAILISGLSYSALSYWLTIKHRDKVSNNYSYREGISLKWLRYCILGVGIVFLSATILITLRDLTAVQFAFNPEYIFYLIIVGFIFYVGYYGIKQENLFSDNISTGFQAADVNRQEEKYRNSGMKDEVAAGMYEKLLEVMARKKPYLNPRLSLAGLAEQLEVTPNQLSQVINQHAKVNFHDFINKYRVEEFIRNAETKKNFSLLALALDSGFNSKSSFNSVFKRQMGITPSGYLSSRVHKSREL